MLIPRNVTFDELMVMHREETIRVRESIEALYRELEEMGRIKWRDSLGCNDVVRKVNVTAYNIMVCALELSQAQDDLDRINKKSEKMRSVK